MSVGKLSFDPSPFLHVTWKIPDFPRVSSCFQYSLWSPKFYFADGRYFIRLLKYMNMNNTHFIRFQLLNVIEYLPGTNVSYEIVLKSRTGKEIYLNRDQISYPREVVFYCAQSELEENRDDIYLPDGVLTVFCSVRLKEPRGPQRIQAGDSETDGADTSNEEEEQEGLPGVIKLLSDYRQLLQKGTESDACFVVRGKEFRAHRCVLRARSAVFEAMFGHETAEKESGRVVIDDLNPDNFGEFLEYLYTGSVEAGLSDDNAFGLYSAADKYDVPTLKSECVAHMRRTLSVGTFCDVMTVALRHREEDLLQKVARFFKANLALIVVTPKWKQLITDNGASANELLVKAFVREELHRLSGINIISVETI